MCQIPRIHQIRIISARTKKKKYYDKQGNLITDETLIADIQRAATVYKYQEEKSGEDKIIIIDKERKKTYTSKTDH